MMRKTPLPPLDGRPAEQSAGLILLWAKMQQEVRPATVACAMAAALGLLLSVVTRSAVTKGTDFFYYFCVSKLVALGHGGQVYDSRRLGVLERSLAFPVRVPGGLIPNVYPPFFAVALAPLADLPYLVAYILWLLLNCIALGSSLVYLEHYAQLGRTGVVVFRTAAFASLPVIVTLLLGQVSFLLLALLCITFHAARTHMDLVAGVSLGLTLIKPQYALPFILVLALQHRYRSLVAFAATAAFLFVVPIAVLGWSSDPSYIRTLMHAVDWGSSVGGFAPKVNRSFGGFAQLLFPTSVATPVSIVLDVIALGAVVVAAFKSREIEVPFGLAVVVALLASQHVLIHDLTLLLIPAAIAWKFRSLAPRGTVILGAFVYLSFYVGFDTSVTRHIQIPTLATTALSVWLFIIVVRGSRMGPGIPSASRAGAQLPAAPL
jgi:Glycosyltransferase family 87